PTEPPGTPTPIPDPVIVDINLGLPPAQLDPARVAPRDATGSDLVENLFIGLTRLNPDTGTVEPWLAREWQVDGAVWQVFLRDDVHWVRASAESGQVEQVRPVAANDVVAAVARACRSPLQSPGRVAVFHVSGCEQIYTQGPEAAQLGVRALNDTVVEFTLREPVGYFPNLLAMPVFRPVPADLIEEAGDAWTDPGQILTSGPYTLQPTIPAEEGYTLVANPFWPFGAQGNAAVVQIGFAGDGFGAWQRGEIAMSTLPESELPAVYDQPAYRMLGQPGVGMLHVSHEIFPFGKPGVRQAFALAINRAALVDRLLQADAFAALPAGTILPPGTTDAPANGGLSYDPDAARAALAEAGHPGCAGIPQTRLLIVQGQEPLRVLADALVEQWLAELNCTPGQLTVEEADFVDVQTLMRDPTDRQFEPDRPALIALLWEGDTIDATHYLTDIAACRGLFPNAYLNTTRECSPVDERLQALLTIQDSAERADEVAAVVAGYFGPQGEMPVIPLFFYGRALAVAEGVTIVPQAAGPLQFDRWIVPED
ncbi:MAG: hypothetical protein GYB64_05555, partial [Chloroflexi bacterium]|nr:hypothetical protein [Chloroflexota bacterium]